ncbi:hypothetical protein LTR10_002569 [Elasticomyces elasticus]|nr:hypothetical protein LTR10_002569 [Elasticomyces elasticus]
MVSTRPDPLPPNADIGPMMVAVAYAFIFPALITTALRLWIRTRDHILGWDDAAILVASLLAIVLSALSIEGTKNGKGRHIWYLNEHQTATIGKLSWIAQIDLFCAICLIKISVCLLVLRIKNTKMLRYSLYAVMVLLVITTIIPIIALCTECKPVYGFWHRKLGHCHSPNFRIYSIYVQASYSAATDLLCSLLPIIIVWNLQMAVSKKIGCNGVRNRKSGLAQRHYSRYDVIETNLGIIATNLAPMRSVMHLFRRQVTQYTHNRSHQHSSNKGGTAEQVSSYGRRSERDMAHAEEQRAASPSGASDESEIPLKAILQTRTYDVDMHSMRGTKS